MSGPPMTAPATPPTTAPGGPATTAPAPAPMTAPDTGPARTGAERPTRAPAAASAMTSLCIWVSLCPAEAAPVGCASRARPRSTRPLPVGSAQPGYDVQRLTAGWLRPAARSGVPEHLVVEVDGRDVVLLAPVVLGVPPLGLVAALGQQVLATHDVVGVEVLGIDPGA